MNDPTRLSPLMGKKGSSGGGGDAQSEGPPQPRVGCVLEERKLEDKDC